jgi:hypothetical protein
MSFPAAIILRLAIDFFFLPVIRSNLKIAVYILRKTEWRVLFCSVLFCSVLFCSVLFCSVLFCRVFAKTGSGKTTNRRLCLQHAPFSVPSARAASIVFSAAAASSILLLENRIGS